MLDRLRSHKPSALVWALAAALAFGIAFSVTLGRYEIPPSVLPGILASKIMPMSPYWTERMETVLFQIRLPRVLLACLVGGSLAMAGAAYQGVFQNPMAAPDLLGASAGASFGAALAILKGFGSSGIIGISFGCALMAVGATFFMGTRTRGQTTLSLVLSGILIGSLFSAGTSFLKMVADPSDQLPAITYWLMGSLSGAKVRDVRFALAPMAASFALLLLLRWRLNVLTFGDEEAAALGLNVRLTRGAVIVSATLMTAAAISVSGTIGWVGLVIPHLSRKIVGNDYRTLLPASLLLGALFMLLVDDVSRSLLSTEIPLSILTSLVGAPFFLYWMTRREEAA